jgi:hypothetical protein
MIRYSFTSQLDPPAPFINISLRNPVTRAELLSVPAQIDTAADRTVIPESIVRTLALPQVGAAKFGGFGGVVHTLPIFAALLQLHDGAFHAIKAAAHAEESWVLLGRDVLNAFRIVLDGPNRTLEID